MNGIKDWHELLDSSVSPFGITGGEGTGEHFTCMFCHTEYGKPPEDAESGWRAPDDEYVRIFRFFDQLIVGECCFRKLEEAIDAIFEDVVDWEHAVAMHLLEQARSRTRAVRRGQTLVVRQD